MFGLTSDGERTPSVTCGQPDDDRLALRERRRCSRGGLAGVEPGAAAGEPARPVGHGRAAAARPRRPSSGPSVVDPAGMIAICPSAAPCAIRTASRGLLGDLERDQLRSRPAGRRAASRQVPAGRAAEVERDERAGARPRRRAANMHRDAAHADGHAERAGAGAERRRPAARRARRRRRGARSARARGSRSPSASAAPRAPPLGTPSTVGEMHRRPGAGDARPSAGGSGRRRTPGASAS